jgi:predicted nucleic acid-binding protein
MTWVVDTCVLLDLACNDKSFAGCAAEAIQSKMDDVLTIAPLTYVELAPQFLGNAAQQDEFLRSLWIECDFDGSRDAVLAAHKAWYAHISRKRAGQVAKRPIADIMIGAYAMQKGGLITRNEADFRSLYPDLPIFNPTSLMS